MSGRSGCRWLMWGSLLFVATIVAAEGFGFIDWVRPPDHILRVEAWNRIRWVMLALHQYEENFERFPNAAVTDEQGRRLHSWRTLILPFLEGSKGSNVHRQIDFARPWKDQLKLDLTTMEFPDFESPRRRGSGKPGLTHFVAVVGPDTVIREHGTVTIESIPDGPANTGVLIEFVDSDIAWAEPRDVTIDEAVRMIQEFDGSKGAIVAMANGHAITVPPDTSAEDIRKLFNCSDGAPPDDIGFHY